MAGSSCLRFWLRTWHPAPLRLKGTHLAAFSLYEPFRLREHLAPVGRVNGTFEWELHNDRYRYAKCRPDG